MRAAELKESCRMAFRAIYAHKLRSCLTLLGVMVGVFSIIVVMTAMRVLQSNIQKELSQLGANTFGIQKWPPVYFGGQKGFEKFWRRKNITYGQAKQFISRTTLPLNIAVEDEFWRGEINSRYAKTSPSVPMRGGTPGTFPAGNLNVVEGRALLQSDVDGARDVCVLGNTLSETLCPSSSALGEKIKMDGINYLVIGVLEPKGAALGGAQDSFAIIPVTSGLNRYGRNWRTLNLKIQAQSAELYEDTVEEARGLLRVIRKTPPGEEDDFEVFSNDSLITQFESFTFSVRIGVAVVSSISLLAAGIGIMNIMLVSVTERTREIGIRRAVGAKKRSIMSQFIIEAILLCELGGIIGVILGIAGGNIAAIIFKMPPVIPVDWILGGLFICSVVGVVFGTYPAYKAANLDPIESLRYE
jgi:putative ABC transport system permease protein